MESGNPILFVVLLLLALVVGLIMLAAKGKALEDEKERQAQRQAELQAHDQAKRQALDRADQQRHHYYRSPEDIQRQEMLAEVAEFWKRHEQEWDRNHPRRPATTREERLSNIPSDAARTVATAGVTAEVRKTPPKGPLDQANSRPVISTWVDAEKFVARWLRKQGHTGVSLSVGGADGGIDVESRTTVAQVKFQSQPVGRPAVQAIYGVAMGRTKKAYFFSKSGYTAPAIEWAAGKVDLYEYRPDGRCWCVRPKSRDWF